MDNFLNIYFHTLNIHLSITHINKFIKNKYCMANHKLYIMKQYKLFLN